MSTRTGRLVLYLVSPLLLYSQVPASEPAVTTPDRPDTASSAEAISKERILGVIPNFQAVNDPATPYKPLHARDKWKLFVMESVDPYTFVSSAAGAAFSQWHNGAPDYGVGTKPYLQRFGAAQADATTQNFFSDAVLAPLLREDPRYFRLGPGQSVLRRIAYATSRLVITRKDTGRNGFNFSGTLGTGLGIALSNAYYPPKSVNGGEMGSRAATSFSGGAIGNLLPEFWPDVKAKLERFRHR